MIYAAQMSRDGYTAVYAYKTLQYFLHEAGTALGVPSHERTLANIVEAGEAQFAFYEVYASEWHATQRLKTCELFPFVAEKLHAALKRAQHVASRPSVSQGGEAGPQ